MVLLLVVEVGDKVTLTALLQVDQVAFGGFNDYGFQDPGTGTSQDSEAIITLTFAEAFTGVQKRFSLGNETIDVRIPSGAKTGTRLRVRGKGQINPMTQQRGDLYLKVELQPHSFFQIEGDNLGLRSSNYTR